VKREAHFLPADELRFTNYAARLLMDAQR